MDLIQLLTTDSKTILDYIDSLGVQKISSSIENWNLYSSNIKETRPLIVAHIDTCNGDILVTKKDLVVTDNTIKLSKKSKSFCLGGDDRNGIFIISQLMKTCKDKFHFVIFDKEEVGMLGSLSFSDVELSYHDTNNSFSCFIGLDRRGSKDIVNYCNKNKDLEQIFYNAGFVPAIGSCSDVSNLARYTDIACVNLSVGFYKEHSNREYIKYEDMINTYLVLKNIKFENVIYEVDIVRSKPKKYNYDFDDNFDFDYGYSSDDYSRFEELEYNYNR